METLHKDRRTSASAAHAAPKAESAQVVRHGIVLQAYIGTVSAVEYLKVHGIAGATINRVLSSEAMRDDDFAALAWREPALPAGETQDTAVSQPGQY